jgi:hypothetical protein
MGIGGTDPDETGSAYGSLYGALWLNGVPPTTLFPWVNRLKPLCFEFLRYLGTAHGYSPPRVLEYD